MSKSGLTLTALNFTGPSVTTADMFFKHGLNVVYGASNAGKSFAVKAIDFMLGGSRPLPGISERAGYERGWLSVHLPASGHVTFMRALAGGSLELHQGHVTLPSTRGENPRELSARHDHTNTDNISQFLLEELGYAGKQIAVDANGKKRGLSFRDLVRFCIVDETAIQSETSPVESTQYTTVTVERSVFKLLITGSDDSAIVPVVDKKTFKTATTAKLEVVDEMITSLTEEIEADFPDSEGLPDQSKRLEEIWAMAQGQFQLAQNSIRARLANKRELGEEISRAEARRAEISVNIGRFKQLEEVYQSDVERLEAIEEAGFLLAVGGDKACPLCGAPPDQQRHSHGLDEIVKARDAANSEVEKIKRQRIDLRATIDHLDSEGRSNTTNLALLHGQLRALEDELNQLAPAADVAKRKLEETLKVRDHVRRGLTLLSQRRSLANRRDDLAAQKPAAKSEKPQLGAPSTAVHDFSQMVSKVLKQWHFPGNLHVAFDLATHDLVIDGKHRRHNGKGVRAITHAAFKVALLLFCRERNLPHPGFLVLDTPLLTYRDPIHSKEGPLSPDEKAISQTSLKDHFFEHLATLGALGQFVVVENVDLPAGIAKLANVQTFTGDPASGRAGLFYTKT